MTLFQNPININIREHAPSFGIITRGNAPGTEGSDLALLIELIMSILFTIAALLLLLNLLWAGMSWISSGGEKGKIEEARNRMTNSIIGIIILACSVAIFMFVQSLLGVRVVNFQGGAAPPVCPAGSYWDAPAGCCIDSVTNNCAG